MTLITSPPKYTNIKRTIPPNRIGRVEGLLNMRRSVSKGDPIAIAFSGYLLFYIIHDNDKWQMANGKWQEPAATSSESLTKTSGPERRAAVRVPVSILAFWALVNTDVGGQYWRRWSILSSLVNTKVGGQYWGLWSIWLVITQIIRLSWGSCAWVVNFFIREDLLRAL